MEAKKYKLSDVLAARTNDRQLKDCPEGLRELFKECPEELTLGRSEYSQGFTNWWYGDSEACTYRISDNWPRACQIEDDTQPAFHREERYIVLKITDIDKSLSDAEVDTLRGICNKVEKYRGESGKRQFECVVVESDWPEYEPTWKSIEQRITNSKVKEKAQPQAPEGYRIVSMEDRERCEYPVDCDVMYDYPENKGGSIHPVTWGGG